MAIELAAARLEILSPAALAARLDGRLAVLTRGPRDAAARHRTLRDAIGWSYDLLSPGEQCLFRGLSLFVGGCDTAAAEAVIGPLAPGAGADAVLNGLSRLLDHHLIHRLREPGEPRFQMLESIREFAVEQLHARGEADPLWRRLAAYSLARAEAANAAPPPEREQHLARLVLDLDNLRATLAWAIDHEAETALRLTVALQHVWMSHASVAEGRSWLEPALVAAGAAAPSVRAEALIWASYFAFLQDDYAQAAAAAGESLTLARAAGDQRGAASALSVLANVAAARQELATAIPLYEEALALHRLASDAGDVGGALANLGLTVGLSGDYERAAALLEEAIARCEAAGHERTAAIAHCSLGEVVRLQGEPARAAVLLAAALDRFLRMGDMTGGIIECWEGLAGVAAAEDPVRAARLLGAAEACRERLGHPLAPALRPRYEATLAVATAALDPTVFAMAWAAGRHLSVDQATAEALGIAGGTPGAGEGTRRRSAANSHGLTSRELEVLRLLTAGRSDREIADALFISPHTAMSHAKNIRRKLGVDSRAAVASYAVRIGLV